MRLTQGIFLEQQQKLIMTPDLRLAIEILQMTGLELNEMINKELEENPFLEESESEEETEIENTLKQEEPEEWLDYFHDREIEYNFENKTTFEHYTSATPSLYDHLYSQLHLSCQDQTELLIAEYLIGNLDNSGYLCIEVEEVARHFKISNEKVLIVLDIVQNSHPPGIGARNLEECLLLQLRHYGKEDNLVVEIVRNYLNELAKGSINKIAQGLGVSTCIAQEKCDLIKTLNPIPGAQFNDNETKYVSADIIVKKIDNEYVIILNDYQIPQLHFNKQYEKLIKEPEGISEASKRFLEEKRGVALRLIKNIEQRRLTLYKVASCIVQIQEEFLEQGLRYLKPLVLREVADKIGVHVSTISRVSNKYIQTPQGLFEIKFFFNSGIDSQDSDERYSSRSVKHLLEEIIKEEDSKKPLSDQRIADILSQKGMQISRRTVAKYRQEMGVPSTTARRRY